MKRKTINGTGTNWGWLDKYSFKMEHVDDMYKGFISLVKVEKIKKRLTVDYSKSDISLFENGYKCLVFLPDGEKWCATAVYDGSGEIVEWYFDMTKINSIDEHGNPFFDDLYLDIAVSPDFRIAILDEDELKDALESGLITKSDYDMAYTTCNKLLNEIIPNKDFLITFFKKYLTALE